MLFVRPLVLTLVATAVFSTPEVRGGNDDGVIIVQLANFATAGKCAQAGLEFQAAELAPLQDYFRADAKLRGLTPDERTKLWQLALGLSEQHVGADTCRKARNQLETWFPTGSMR